MNKCLRIKEVLREHGVTQKQVAKKMGVGAPSLSLSLKGNPTIDTLQKVADAIGCNIKELFK